MKPLLFDPPQFKHPIHDCDHATSALCLCEALLCYCTHSQCCWLVVGCRLWFWCLVCCCSLARKLIAALFRVLFICWHIGFAAVNQRPLHWSLLPKLLLSAAFLGSATPLAKTDGQELDSIHQSIVIPQRTQQHTSSSAATCWNNSYHYSYALTAYWLLFPITCWPCSSVSNISLKRATSLKSFFAASLLSDDSPKYTRTCSICFSISATRDT